MPSPQVLPPFPLVEYATEKFPDRAHYRGAMYRLGDDEHGTWIWGPAGRTIYRGDEALFVASQPALAVIPSEAWWSASWFIGHPEVELYVNINTPARDEGHRIVAVDVDLDVVRFTDGRVEVVDRDEFEVHQRVYGYPQDLIDATEAATADAAQLVARAAPPFDGDAARGWMAVALAASLPTPTA